MEKVSLEYSFYIENNLPMDIYTKFITFIKSNLCTLYTFESWLDSINGRFRVNGIIEGSPLSIDEDFVFNKIKEFLLLQGETNISLIVVPQLFNEGLPL